jgi:hypothetical protein
MFKAGLLFFTLVFFITASTSRGYMRKDVYEDDAFE